MVGSFLKQLELICFYLPVITDYNPVIKTGLLSIYGLLRLKIEYDSLGSRTKNFINNSHLGVTAEP